jgi:hypothetical protein
VKTWIQFFFSAVIGFFVVSILLNNFTFDFTKHGSTIVIGMLVVIFVMLVSGLLIYRQIRKLNSKEVYGEEEDEVDVRIYKRFADYSFIAQSSITFSLIALSISVTNTQQILLPILATVGLLISYVFSLSISHLTQLLYPERNLPSITDKNYAEKLLEASDEGERHANWIL